MDCSPWARSDDDNNNNELANTDGDNRHAQHYTLGEDTCCDCCEVPLKILQFFQPATVGDGVGNHRLSDAPEGTLNHLLVVFTAAAAAVD